MKTRRFQKYLKAKAAKKANPLQQKEEIQKDPDNKIDHAKEEVPKPKTKTPKKVAAAGMKKDEKKKTSPAKKKGKTKE